MNLETSFTIAAKELKVIRRKKSIIYSIIFLPFLLAVGFSLVVRSRISSIAQIMHLVLTRSLTSSLFYPPSCPLR